MHLASPAIVFSFIIINCLAAFIGGYAGFGSGIIAVSLVTFIPYNIQILIDSISLILFIPKIILILIARTNGKILWKTALLILFGCLIGIPLGYKFIVIFGNQSIFRICLGAILILLGINGIKSSVKKMAKYWAIPIGILSGFLTGAFLMGGPPFIMYLYSRTDEPQKMKATIQFILFFMLIIRGVSMFVDQATVDYANIIWLNAWTLPFVIPIIIISHRLSLNNSPQIFRKVIYRLITMFGSIILTKALMQ
ncbi:MAG: sulfite exporter TauE/SafE family protein [Hormoscilla sp.]